MLQWVRLPRAMALCTLAAAILGIGLYAADRGSRPAGGPPQRPAPVPPRRRGRVASILWRARCWRTLAIIAVNNNEDALETWDPGGSASLDWEAWRLHQLALDRAGLMHRSRALALRAASLARNPDDAYASAELLVVISHEMDDHETELRQARQLVALRPHSECAAAVLLVVTRRSAGRLFPFPRSRQPGRGRPVPASRLSPLSGGQVGPGANGAGPRPPAVRAPARAMQPPIPCRHHSAPPLRRL